MIGAAFHVADESLHLDKVLPSGLRWKKGGTIKASLSNLLHKSVPKIRNDVIRAQSEADLTSAIGCSYGKKLPSSFF